MVSSRSKPALAAEVWRLLSDYVMHTFRERAGVLEELGLTPGHLKALRALEPGVPRPMGVCAQAVGCDASTATWLIDRLEERGLVERRPSPTDRRIKAVVLTPSGVETKAVLDAHFYAAPDDLLDFDRATLLELRRLLVTLAAS